MKHLFIFIAILASTCTLSAQWIVGAKLSSGIIIQDAEDFRIFPASDRIYDLEYIGGSATYSVGMMAYNDLGPFFLQVEALATTYSLEYRLDNFRKISESSPIYSEDYYTIELPFVAGVKVLKKFKLGLGPIIDIVVDKNSQFQEIDNYRNTTKPLELGFQALLGYNLGIMHIDLKYINKFNSIADGFNFGGDDMKLDNSANRLSLSVGFAF